MTEELECICCVPACRQMIVLDPFLASCLGSVSERRFCKDLARRRSATEIEPDRDEHGVLLQWHRDACKREVLTRTRDVTACIVSDLNGNVGDVRHVNGLRPCGASLVFVNRNQYGPALLFGCSDDSRTSGIRLGYDRAVHAVATREAGPGFREMSEIDPVLFCRLQQVALFCRRRTFFLAEEHFLEPTTQPNREGRPSSLRAWVPRPGEVRRTSEIEPDNFLSVWSGTETIIGSRHRQVFESCIPRYLRIFLVSSSYSKTLKTDRGQYVAKNKDYNGADLKIGSEGLQVSTRLGPLVTLTRRRMWLLTKSTANRNQFGPFSVYLVSDMSAGWPIASDPNIQPHCNHGRSVSI